jgi:tRNA1(Val) A37 N6-methylase TrmN6
MAMHGTGLTLRELVVAVDRLLNEHGKAAFLLPPHRMVILTNLMQDAGLFEKQTLTLKHSRNHKILRSIRVFSRSITCEPTDETLIIREPDGSYTPSFNELMKPYYLFI